SADYHHPESGPPHITGPVPDLRQRCLGARLLPEVQQPPSRIPGGLVECRELGRDQPAFRSLQVSQRAGTGAPLKPAGPDASSGRPSEARRLLVCGRISDPPHLVHTVFFCPSPASRISTLLGACLSE